MGKKKGKKGPIKIRKTKHQPLGGKEFEKSDLSREGWGHETRDGGNRFKSAAAPLGIAGKQKQGTA